MGVLLDFLSFPLFIVFLSQVVCLPVLSFTSSAHLCPPDQSLALFQFKKMISSSHCSSKPRKILPSWEEGTDCCLWDGVTCDNVTGNVIGLNLADCNLCGTIDSNSSLFLLSHLQRLNLAFNGFYMSEFPSTISRLACLTHLNLSHLDISGSVPQEISHLSKLVSLDLSQIYVDLSIENVVMKSLVQNMTKLRVLSLRGVHMSDVAPHSLLNLSSSLTTLDLDSCDLGENHGEKFPVHIFQLPNLQWIQLSYNSMIVQFPESNWTSPIKFLVAGSTERLPDSIGDLKYLEHLEVDGTGELPNSIGNLLSLKELILSGFTGSIPASIGNITQITEIHLASNNFSGGFPVSFGKLQNLVNLEIADNNFTAQIPNAFSNLTKLTSIDLQSNNFFGKVPSSLFALPLLSQLDLSYNQLDDFNDDFQANSSQFSSVRMSNNELHGRIPRSLFELINLRELDLSLNNMTGFLDLEMISKLKNLTLLDLSHNSLTLSPSGHVNYTFPMLESLYLSSCNLTEFPIFLKGSGSVVGIDLSDNRIHGQVPEWFLGLGADSLIYLNLSHNFLTSISHFPWNGLNTLDLHSNFLQGSLPDFLPSSGLFLSNNKFSGEIPSSFCNSTDDVQIIDLSNNNLNGRIPQCLGNLSSSLYVLDLRINNFSGPIVAEFGDCEALTTLGLNRNKLEGVLPRSLLNCSNLQVLDVGNNKISGEFPHWIGSLPNLQVLVLRSNKFRGPIADPKTKFPFPMLRIMDVSHNEFTGPLPEFYFKNFKAMMTVNHSTEIYRFVYNIGLRNSKARKSQYMGGDYYDDHMMSTMKGKEIELVKILSFLATIDFSCNNFSGKILGNVGELKSLKGLNFSHNNLEGHIPSSLGSLTNLEWLDLSSNRLAGEIPEKLLDITFLEVLNLSYNRLVEHIPEGKQFSTFSNDSYIGNSGLCGFPLSKKCNKQQPAPPPSFSSSGSEFGFGWKVVALGYGCGAIFGTIMGYLMFLTGKPRWLVRVIAKYEPRRKVRRPRNGGRRHGNRRN